MKTMEDYLITFGEELGKESYSIVKAGVNTFFKAKGELASYTLDSYINARLDIRMEDFAYEQNKLTDDERKIFYDNINYTQLNYLFELLNKARTSTFDIHAKILSKFYGHLLKQGDLSYFESNILSNITMLNEEDICIIFKELGEVFTSSVYQVEMKLSVEQSYETKRTFSTMNSASYYAFKKAIQIGIVRESNDIPGDLKNGKRLSENYYINEYTEEFYLILKDILHNKC